MHTCLLRATDEITLQAKQYHPETCYPYEVCKLQGQVTVHIARADVEADSKDEGEGHRSPGREVGGHEAVVRLLESRNPQGKQAVRHTLLQGDRLSHERFEHDLGHRLAQDQGNHAVAGQAAGNVLEWLHRTD
jgi:hypothetical protein